MEAPWEQRNGVGRALLWVHQNESYAEISSERRLIMPGIYQVPFFLESGIFDVFNLPRVETNDLIFPCGALADRMFQSCIVANVIITSPSSEFPFPGF